MRSIFTAIVLLWALPGFCQEEKEILVPERQEDIKPMQLQPAPQEPVVAPLPERPSYIDNTHLPPPHKKKEFEEAERKAYVRPEPIFPVQPEN